ncbi:MAG: NAD(P)-dependent glycerol-3-phosphate dehydrogenase [Planctomycetota bacterium]|nr:NAD(P)-dependent glycerol-3-phosphate dehydrogenase [Planctomycetota bacterium]
MRVAVIGGGGWGTALAAVCVGRGHETVLWCRETEVAERINRDRENAIFLPGVRLPDRLRATCDAAEALRGAGMVICAVPTQHIRATFSAISGYWPRDALIVSAAKGIEIETGLRPSEVFREVLGVAAVALSGPSHAAEVARGLPASVAAASPDDEACGLVQRALMNERLRIYRNADIVGVELGGALKNVIAIAAGICDGLGLGDNSKAALITRGLSEMSRLGVAMGARPETFAGLSGLGDLVTTCYSPLGRNLAVGRRIGRGERLDAILASMSMVAEGVPTTRAAVRLASRLSVEMPITAEVHKVLFEGRTPMDAVLQLMTRAPKAE